MCLRTTFPYVLFDCYPCLVAIHLRAIKTCFSNLFLALFIFLYQYPVKKSISGIYMAVQYLKEFMSIYKGTFMKLLKKKSDFSAVEFRLWITWQWLFISIYYKYKADFQHNKQLMTCISASFVHLTSNQYEKNYFKHTPPFFLAS